MDLPVLTCPLAPTAYHRPPPATTAPAPPEEHPLKADPAAQRTLLDIQAIDSRVVQLRHQRRTLPEIAEITTLQESRFALDDQRRDAQIVVDDLVVEQTKVDRDVESVKTRRTRDQDRMDKGLITNPKDLERMQGELVSLQRRITSLEDDELEVMVRLEEAQGTLEETTSQIAEADARLSDLVTARDEKWSELDAQVATAELDREPLLAGVPADLLALYDRLREQKGGVGAAELRLRACGGCRLGIDNAELATIRSAPEDLVVRCEECTRILVRTPESGL